jgi:hypothetical protein
MSVASRDLNQIGGALARFWAGGAGPSRAQIESALMIAGQEATAEGNKQQLVLGAVVDADDGLARGVIEELISLLREHGYFENAATPELQEAIARLKRTFLQTQHQLDDAGFVTWGAGGSRPSAPGGRISPIDEAQRAIERPPDARADIDFVCASLRRLGSGAFAPAYHPTAWPGGDLNHRRV